MLFGKERDLLGHRCAIVGKEVNGLLPGSFLAAIEFTQIENMALKDLAPGDPAVFDNAPIKVFLAILETFFTAQKHDGAIMSGSR